MPRPSIDGVFKIDIFQNFSQSRMNSVAKQGENDAHFNTNVLTPLLNYGKCFGLVYLAEKGKSLKYYIRFGYFIIVSVLLQVAAIRSLFSIDFETDGLNTLTAIKIQLMVFQFIGAFSQICAILVQKRLNDILERTLVEDRST